MPVINENDTVATAEIRFGDNDRLAARVAAMISADTLVLLSDIDGLYTADPRKDKSATPHRRDHRDDAGDRGHGRRGAAPAISSGGMVTKLAAARIAMSAGCRMAIADGRRMNPLQAIARRRALHLVPAGLRAADRAQALDRRLAEAAGTLTVDAGALTALTSGRSLLPAGVIRVEGEFERGDAVLVADARRPRGGARPRRLFGRAMPGASWATRAAKSTTCSAIVAATR